MSEGALIDESPAKRIAVTGQALYLLNLLFPLLPLFALAWLHARHGAHAPRLARVNTRQALAGAAVSTGLFAAANLLILALGGYRSLHALIIFEVYYIVVVPAFLVPGLIALIKALSGQLYRFPLLGGKDAA